MKKGILFTLLLCLCTVAFAQVEVRSGAVDLKSNTFIDGNVYIRKKGNTLRLSAANSTTVEIGASTGEILFWYTGVGYHNLRVKSITEVSDSTLKENIIPLRNGLNVVKQLEPCSYNFKSDKAEVGRFTKNTHYGLIAQDVDKVLPDVVSTTKGLMSVNYTELIPFLINAIKEQQAQIEELQKIVAEQKE